MKNKFWVALSPIFYRMFFVLLMTGVVIKGFGNYLGIRNLSSWHWFLVIVASMLLAWINYGTVKGKVMGLVLLGLCGTVMIPFLGAGRIEGFFANYFQWIIWGKDYVEEWILGYELIQVLWVVLGCYLFQVVSQKSRVIKELAAVVLLGLLIFCMVKKIHIEQIGVALIFCYILICVIERIRSGWNKTKTRDGQGYIMWLAPFLGLYVLILCLVPYREEPYDWAFAKKIYNNLHEKFTVWFENNNRQGKEDFGSFLTGFSENAEIADSGSKERREIMQVSGNRSLMTNMYLPGKYYDSFEGRTWKQTVTKDTGEYPLDALEILYALERFDPDWVFNYVRNTKVTVTYSHFDTGYVFVPLKPSYLSKVEFQIEGRDFKFGEQKGYGTTYDVSFYQMNLDTDNFVSLLETKQEENEEIWLDIVVRYAPEGKKTLTAQDLADYRQRMAQSYSKEIVLSEKVEKYLTEITKDCETPYERLKAIERELSGYTYTLNPGKLPETVDTPEEFLEYFLLESRQGFCTYFATAFTLLAQAEGFPARYVEGFCVPSNFTTGETTVYSDMAHAWPEVYIEGVGWIPFEPTPGYSTLRYKGWLERVPVTEPSATAKPGEDVETESQKQEEIQEEGEENNSFRIVVVLKVLCIIFPVILLAAWLERMRQKRLYARMSTEQKFEVEVKKNLWLLARLDCKRGETETLSELQVRIREILPELAKGRSNWQFIERYEEYLYREDEVSSAVLEECIAQREEILEWIKENRKGYYYLIRVWLYFSM